MYKHILIATDGSDFAAKGTEHGLALAEALAAKVTVLRVVEPLEREAAKEASDNGIDNPVIRYDQQIDDTMRRQFASFEQRAAEHGVAVELLHEIDDVPSKAIVRTARLTGCDLIVMTTHGRRGAQRLMLGSQTDDVVTHTDVPVLVVQ
jgi:nucleotide-binding universal stress UspA family protein